MSIVGFFTLRQKLIRGGSTFAECDSAPLGGRQAGREAGKERGTMEGGRREARGWWEEGNKGRDKGSDDKREGASRSGGRKGG